MLSPLLRGEHRLRANSGAAPVGVPLEHIKALDRVAAAVGAMRAGEGASTRQVFAQRQGQTRGMRM